MACSVRPITTNTILCVIFIIYCISICIVWHVFVETNIKKAAVKLCRTLINSRRSSGKETNFVTVMYGKDILPSDASAVVDEIKQKVGSSVEVTAISGGQPVYYYILSVE